MQRLTLIAQLPLTVRLALIAGAVALVGCPGNAPQLDPKFLTGGGGGTTGSGGQGGCTPSPVPAVCARGADGLRCALSDGVSALGASAVWAPALSDPDWASPERYETIAYPDVDGDGRADVCARATYGLVCGLDTGTDFDPLAVWAAGLDDANGWYAEANYRTLRYADLNADGMQDVCVRANNGIYCGLSNGSSFLGLTVWANLSMGVDWLEPEGYVTLQYPDLNNDDMADLCVRGNDGLMCALSNGATFGPLDLWSDTFSDDSGWAAAKHYTTIRFPDLNGDGMADVCGRASDGIRCALSNGTTYGTANVWLAQLSDANDWDEPKYYETIDYADVDGDGSDDLCARASDGVYCALRGGASFGPHTLWANAFADAAGWNTAQHYSTIHHPDLDGDGKADICGRSSTGMLCGLSEGTSFAVSLWSSDFSDGQGFDVASSYTTLRTPVLDPDTCP